ncbi:FAD-binding protein [Robbsia sp. KACC 23696]|uniref:L-aspartate oxidase n=1 Tax=Robbsia sp. KACC 23696 TaxID=3149231 RepID=UPI00325A9C4E
MKTNTETARQAALRQTAGDPSCGGDGISSTAPIIVVGAGLAGLTVALTLVEQDAACEVIVLAKRHAMEGASDRAQGGIAAVLDATDSVDDHVRDTLVAGAGVCDEPAVRAIVAAGRESIDWLIAQGVAFTPDDEAELGYHLTREGGHSHRRIIHAADATGHAVLTAVHARAREHRRIRFLEETQAIDLVVSETGSRRCVGVSVLDRESGQCTTLAARAVVLATGGAGQVYPHTSNPATATGDGIAMAARVGCRVANLEFIQFHPTCLYEAAVERDLAATTRAESDTSAVASPSAAQREWTFLISEAVRGEGGILRRPNDGYRFMPALDPRAELAPRDIVARAITREMLQHGLDYVHLDISHQSADFLETHFPTILAHCLTRGIDMRHEPIPVVPAAHYTCGGVVTDTSGRTDLSGLFVVGEAGCTGLHGANRLASNSLLECVVIGRNAAAALQAMARTPEDGIATAIDQTSAAHAGAPSDVPRQDVVEPRTRAGDGNVGNVNAAVSAGLESAIDPVVVRTALRALMWQAAGIQRDGASLLLAQRQIAAWRAAMGDAGSVGDIEQLAANTASATQMTLLATRRIDLRNLLTIAALIVDGAVQRAESRGAHYRFDAPHTWPKGLPTILMGSAA